MRSYTLYVCGVCPARPSPQLRIAKWHLDDMVRCLFIDDPCYSRGSGLNYELILDHCEAVFHTAVTYFELPYYWFGRVAQ
jgi:hypothetical protein